MLDFGSRFGWGAPFLVFLARNIGPEVLKAIEIAIFLEEYVDKDVAIIEDDPEIVSLALGTKELVSLLLHLLLDVVADCTHLGGVGSVAYYEIVGNGTIDAPEIYRNNVLPLLVVHGVCYEPQVVSNHFFLRLIANFAFQI